MPEFYGVYITGLLFPWDDPKIYDPIARAMPLCGYELRKHDGHYDTSHLVNDELVIDGHSLGGWQGYVLCVALIPKKIKLLVLRDPVKPNWNTRPLPVPANVEVAICFHRNHPKGLEIPPCFKLQQPDNLPPVNVYRRLAHTEFITDPTINIWEHETIKRLEEA